jgi:prepilin-type N-terminal cleavage/methylation domain-containing protein
MSRYKTKPNIPFPAICACMRDEPGFSLVEFLIASVILLIVSVSVFGVLTNVQRSSSYQTEVQAVLDNTRIAMETVTRILRQAGNDPKNLGIQGITIASASQVQIRADLTGSAGGDTGDPDGDTADSGENVTINYNAGARSIELTPNGGSTQTIATDISAFSMQYFDAAGAATNVGADVRRIRVSLSGASALPDPQTGQTFSQQMVCDVQIANRK